MTCPRCHSEFETAESVCPECGVRLLRNISGVMKTSAVMIAAQGERGFYRSVQDVPEPLRTQLIETTNSSNSGIIVIADRAGKEQLTQVMARREAGREGTGREGIDATPFGSRDTAASNAGQAPRVAGEGVTRLPWLAWAGFVVVLVLAAILFEIFRNDWAILKLHW
jgi:hypothetical protein